MIYVIIVIAEDISEVNDIANDVKIEIAEAISTQEEIFKDEVIEEHSFIGKYTGIDLLYTSNSVDTHTDKAVICY